MAMKYGSDFRASVLIYEPNHSGHRLGYVAILARAAEAKGMRVTVLTRRQVLASEEWEIHLADLKVETIVLEPRRTNEILHLGQAAQQVQADRVVVPDADRLLFPLLRFGWQHNGSLACLIMRPNAQGSGSVLRTCRTAIKRFVALLVGARNGVEVFRLASPYSSSVRKRGWIPDPADLTLDHASMSSAREALDKGGPRYWVGLLGSITARKNPMLVMKALEGLEGIGLLVMGKIDPAVQEEVRAGIERLKQSGVEVVEQTGSIPQLQFDSWLRAVDVVMVAHSNEGPSGIVLKAALAGRQMILSGAQSLRRDARRLGSAAVWTPLDACSMRFALQKVAANRPQAPQHQFETGEFADGLLGQ